MQEHRRIVSVDRVPDDSTFLFTVRDPEADERKEAILVRLDGDVVGWLNYCQHFRHINLDKGTGAELRNGEIVCTNHGAYFEADSGLCTFGPCEGAYLDEVSVATADGEVYLADDRYEFVRVGPIEDDQFDLSSESNVEF